MGYFLNPVALRIKLSSDLTVRQLLHRARDLTVGAMAHDEVTLEHLARDIGCGTDPSRHLYFQSLSSLAPTLPELGAGWDQTFFGRVQRRRQVGSALGVERAAFRASGSRTIQPRSVRSEHHEGDSGGL